MNNPNISSLLVAGSAIADAAQGTIIITVNNRVAQALHEQYNHALSASGNCSWPTPAILPFDRWVEQLYRSILYSAPELALPFCLNSMQNFSLWQQIVEQSDTPLDLSLIDSNDFAEYACRAQQLLTQFKVQYDSVENCLNWGITAESEVMLNWLSVYQNWCRQHGVTEQANLLTILIRHAAELVEAVKAMVVITLNESTHLNQQFPSTAASIACIRFQGFDDFSPLQLEFLNTLKSQHISLKLDNELVQNHLSPGQVSRNQLVQNPLDFAANGNFDGKSAETRADMPDFQLVRPEDKLSEIASALHWAKHETIALRNQARQSSENSAQHGGENPSLNLIDRKQIAIVIPDLKECLVHVQRLAKEMLETDGYLNNTDEIPRNFNISLAQPLLDYPIIHAAWLVLKLTLQTLSAKEMSEFLASAYVADFHQHKWTNMGIEAVTREQANTHIDLHKLQRLCLGGVSTSGFTYAAENLSQQVETALEKRQLWSRDQPASKWVYVFNEILQHFGWPGSETLSSSAYQAQQRLNEIWKLYATLDRVVPVLNADKALQQLYKLLSEELFQPQRQAVTENGSAPVQILGLMEAAGQNLDKIWITGLDIDTWPTKSKLNPLLPVGLQRDANMPGSSHEVDLDYANKLLHRMVSPAEEIIFSVPLFENEKKLTPSPIIEQYIAASEAQSSSNSNSRPNAKDIQPPTLINAHHSVREWIAPSARKQRYHPGNGSHYAPGSHLKGGSTMLQDQSLCPFRAFARHRLQASTLPRKKFVIDAQVKGILVHRFMELLGSEWVKNPALLRSQGQNYGPSIASHYRQLAQQAIRSAEKFCRCKFSQHLVEVETNRLIELANSWKVIEAARSEFKIEAIEKSVTVTLGGLRFNLRLDRVDLAAGYKLLIDYKTGSANARDWWGERPLSPQLPLYAIAMCASENRQSVGGIAIARMRGQDLGYEGVSVIPGHGAGWREFGAGRGMEKHFDDMSAALEHWTSALSELAEEFRLGLCSVTPQPSACTFCEFPTLCRLNEILGNSGRS